MGKRKPGGGWRWVIAIACCWCNCMLYGVSRLSGLLLIYFIDDLHITRASASIPFSVSTSLRNLSGPFVGFLAQKFGIRIVCSCGCLLATFGIALCFISQSIVWTTIFWGIFFGIGYGMGTTLLPQVINQNFEKFRSTASGIAYSGAYIGSSVFPIFLNPIMKEYGFSGGFLLLAGIVLHSLLAAMLFRSPVKDENSKSTIVGSSVPSNHDVWRKEYTKIYSRGSCVYPIVSDVNVECKDWNDNPVKSSLGHCQLVINVSALAGYQIKNSPNKDYTHSVPYSAREGFSRQPPFTVTKPKCINKDDQQKWRWSRWLCPILKAIDPKVSRVNKPVKTHEPSTITNKETTKMATTREKPSEVCKSFKVLNDSDCSHETEYSVCKSTTRDKSPKGRSELVRIFRNPMFCIVCVTSSMYSFVTSCILTIIEDYAKDMGTPESLVYLVLMVLSLSNLFGSLSLGWITDRALISRRLFVIICYLGMALSLVIIPSCCDFNEILILVSAYGVLEAGVLINSPLLLAECIEDKNQVLAIASRDVLSAPTVLLVPVVLSVFRDRLGSYNQVFYLLSFTSLLCSIVWIFVPGVLRKSLTIQQIEPAEP